MAKKKLDIPVFETAEEEGAFWETHSPADYGLLDDMKPAAVERRADQPISIRLRSRERAQLDAMARAHRMGPSRFVRTVVEGLLARPEVASVLLAPTEAAPAEKGRRARQGSGRADLDEVADLVRQLETRVTMLREREAAYEGGGRR